MTHNFHMELNHEERYRTHYISTMKTLMTSIQKSNSMIKVDIY